ncbi:MAG: hypothetical protein ABSC38_00810 [Verrucomicrobiia bacterium]
MTTQPGKQLLRLLRFFAAIHVVAHFGIGGTLGKNASTFMPARSLRLSPGKRTLTPNTCRNAVFHRLHIPRCKLGLSIDLLMAPVNSSRDESVRTFTGCPI